MPKITGDRNTFISGKTGKVCTPLPDPGPSQRGPSCGFYALGHVMQYWHGKLTDPLQRVPKPLPARTHMEGPKPASYAPDQRQARNTKAADGVVTSLRQYGKLRHVTAYGSVFDAENLVQVARLKGVEGHAGTYDGHVITTTGQDDYIQKVKELLGQECPVIVPFDVDREGDPCLKSGKAAHWTVIFGWYSEDSTVYFIHYHWGAYRYSRAQDFASSTRSLTSNAFLILQKTEVTLPRDGRVVKRDYIAVRRRKDYSRLGLALKDLGDPVPNVEFNNPAALGLPFELNESNELLRQHGFDPMNVTNAGLKDKLVAIYPRGHKPQ